MITSTLLKTLLLSILIGLTSAQATVNVVRYPSGTLVKVCQPADTDPTCAAAAGAGTVTNVSVVNANGFSASVANPTTTPAITFNNINWTAAAPVPMGGINWSDAYNLHTSVNWYDVDFTSRTLAGEMVNKGWQIAAANPSQIDRPTAEISAMCNYQGNMYIGYDNSTVGSSNLFKWNGKTNTFFYQIGQGSDFQHINACEEYNGKLFISNSGQTAGQGVVYVYDPNAPVSNFVQTPSQNGSGTAAVIVPNDSSNNAIFGSTAYSVEYYGRIDDLGSSGGYLINKLNSGSSTGFVLRIVNGAGSNTLSALIHDGSLKTTTTSTTFTLGNYHDIIFSWTSAAAPKIYIDGVEASYSATAAATTPTNDTANSLIFGNSVSNTRSIGATFRKVRIWRGYALTASDVTSLYAGGSAASSPTGQYLFTEGSGTTTADSSGNSNTGTLSGGAYWNSTLFDIAYANGAEQFIYSLKKFKGRLFAASGFSTPGLIYAFDGTTWSQSYAGLATYGLIDDMYVYKGRLFAFLSGSGNGAIISTDDGVTWTTEISGVVGAFTRGTEFKGKLFVGHFATTNNLYVRDDATGTWSVRLNITPSTLNQCWGLANYNNSLYLGCTNTTASTLGGYIYKSYDGYTFNLDLAIPNGSQPGGTTPTEVFTMNNYDGSLYAGLGFHTGNADLWRKTDSYGQLIDNTMQYLKSFYGNTNSGVNWTEDYSNLNINIPVTFNAGINWTGINWTTIGGYSPGKILTASDAYGNINWSSLPPSGGGSGTVTSVSVVTANGFSGSVANPTTTPAITLNNINWTAATPVPTAGINWSDINYSVGQVLTKTPTGVNWSDMSGSSSGGSVVLTDVPYVKVTNTQSSGVNGGTATAGSWTTLPLNTEDQDTASIATLSSDQITLPAGTYKIYAAQQFYLCDNFQLRLYDVTNAAILINGTSGYNSSASQSYVFPAQLAGVITLSGTTTIRLEYRVTSTSTNNGLGVANSFGTQVYGLIELWQISKTLSGGGGGGGSGTVTSVSVTTANGISGSVATATTTPAITINPIALGGINWQSMVNIIKDININWQDIQYGKLNSAGINWTNINSAGVINAGAVTSKTGTSNTFVLDTSPTLITPVLGTATATQITANAGTTGFNSNAVFANAGNAGGNAFSTTNNSFTTGAMYNGSSSSASYTGTGLLKLTYTGNNSGVLASLTTVNPSASGNVLNISTTGTGKAINETGGGTVVTTFQPTTFNGINWTQIHNIGQTNINWSDMYNLVNTNINWSGVNLTVNTLNWTSIQPLNMQYINWMNAPYLNNTFTNWSDMTIYAKTLRSSPVVGSIADATSFTPLTASTINSQTNTQASGTLTINAPVGDVRDGKSLLFRFITTNAQTFSWNAIYHWGTAGAPTTTSGSSKADYYSCLYFQPSIRWDCTGQALGFN